MRAFSYLNYTDRRFMYLRRSPSRFENDRQITYELEENLTRCTVYLNINIIDKIIIDRKYINEAVI